MGETLRLIATDGMQVLGGESLSADGDMQRYWREGASATIAGGTSEIQRPIISQCAPGGTGWRARGSLHRLQRPAREVHVPVKHSVGVLGNASPVVDEGGVKLVVDRGQGSAPLA